MRKKNTSLNFWEWYVYSKNGKKVLTCPKFYTNRAQCRNVMMEFSRRYRITYKEIG
jgi:hypothetical protein